LDGPQADSSTTAAAAAARGSAREKLTNVDMGGPAKLKVEETVQDRTRRAADRAIDTAPSLQGFARSVGKILVHRSAVAKVGLRAPLMLVAMLKDLSLSAVVAGFVAVLVGFSSAAVIVLQAAHALNATPAQSASWVLALGVACGVTSIALSLRYRMPILTAWSTPGAALLVTSVRGVSMGAAVGAFMVCAALIVVVGATGWFEKAIKRIPETLGAAMLAGVLLRFGLDGFAALGSQLVLVGSMLVTYLVMRRFLARYAIPAVLAVGAIVAALGGQLHTAGFHVQLARPVFVMPIFSLSAILSVALPLFVVTMASQNVPGVAVLRASGYEPPVSPLVTWTGFSALVLAPFGAFAVNLAAIVAAITMGKDAHNDPDKRYMAAVSGGVFYILFGLAGATVAAVFAIFPKEMVFALAGLALLNTIGSGLAAAVRDEARREPALITFLVTASGLHLFSIGAAFWGLVAGVLASAILHAPLGGSTASAA
jgi:benzoate membrane transport protein